MSSPNYTQTWFVQGKVLGQWPIGLQRTCSTIHAPQSLAYYCPVCGDVWARRIIAPETNWMFWSVHCPRHPDAPVWRRPPGTLILSFFLQDETFNFPKELYAREALLYIEAALKEKG